jgi:hypothetical protein
LLPGELWRAWEHGQITRVELWEELEAQLGAPYVRKLLGLPIEWGTPQERMP